MESPLADQDLGHPHEPLQPLSPSGAIGQLTWHSQESQRRGEPRIYTRFRRHCFEFLTRDQGAHLVLRTVSLIYEIVLCILVLVLFFVGAINNNSTTLTEDTYGLFYACLEDFLTVIFGIEYVMKVFSCVEEPRVQPSSDVDTPHLYHWRLKTRLRKMVEPIMMIDLVTCVGMAAEAQSLDGFAAFRILRIFRILTLLRLEQNFKVMNLLINVVNQNREELAATLMLAVALLLVISAAMFYIEAPYNPMFDTLWKSMWWGTAALTTVGYGDIYPITGVGKVVGSVVAFMGVGMFALPAGILASGFQDVVQARKKKDGKEAEDLSTIVGNLEVQMCDVQASIASIHASQRETLKEQRRVAHLLEQLLQDGGHTS